MKSDLKKEIFSIIDSSCYYLDKIEAVVDDLSDEELEYLRDKLDKEDKRIYNIYKKI